MENDESLCCGDYEELGSCEAMKVCSKGTSSKNICSFNLGFLKKNDIKKIRFSDFFDILYIWRFFFFMNYLIFLEIFLCLLEFFGDS